MKKKTAGWASKRLRYVLPVMICLAIIPIIFGLISINNAKDAEYEARHKHFASISETGQELGGDGLLYILSGYDLAEIDVGYLNKESVNASSWTDIEVRIQNEKELISLVIYSPLFTGRPMDHLGADYEVMNIGDTSVKYKLFRRESGYSDYQSALYTDFNYKECHYIFIYFSNDSLNEGYNLLRQMLEK